MNWFLIALKKYAVFTGRSRRKEYWFWVLFVYIILFVLAYLDTLMGTYNPATYMGTFSGLFLLLMIIPNIAVSIRRLHDTDRSGWWILIGLIPLIGTIWYFVLMVLDGTVGANQYGEDPKGR